MAGQIRSGNFTFLNTPIEDVMVIESKQFIDDRGSFAEVYKQSDFETGGIPDVFVQENQSTSRHGVLRGLHYQKKHPQSKLVRVMRGEAFDVAVDLRKDSPTFGKWYGELLSSENGKQLYIPHGCAHGILILSDEATFAYKADDVYHPEDEGAIAWDDSDIAIDWPISSEEIILSVKDASNPSLKQVFGIYVSAVSSNCKER